MTAPAWGLAGKERWAAERPPVRPLRLILAWLVSAVALFFAAWIVPGVRIPSEATGDRRGNAVVAVFNARCSRPLLWSRH